MKSSTAETTSARSSARPTDSQPYWALTVTESAAAISAIAAQADAALCKTGQNVNNLWANLWTIRQPTVGCGLTYRKCKRSVEYGEGWCGKTRSTECEAQNAAKRAAHTHPSAFVGGFFWPFF